MKSKPIFQKLYDSLISEEWNLSANQLKVKYLHVFNL